MSVGTHLRAPFSVILADKSVVEIVDSTGALTGSIMPDEITQDTLVDTNKKIEFRSSGIFINSPSAGKLQISADGGGADDITLSGGVTVTGDVAMTGDFGLTGLFTASAGIQARAVAVTATSDGLTTGIIPDDTTHAEVTSASANNIVTLPTPTPGLAVRIRVGSNGCKLQTSTPASITLNGGSGSGAKSAIAADTLVLAFCKTSTKWVAIQIADAGTVSAVTPAA